MTLGERICKVETWVNIKKVQGLKEGLKIEPMSAPQKIIDLIKR